MNKQNSVSLCLSMCKMPAAPLAICCCIAAWQKHLDDRFPAFHQMTIAWVEGDDGGMRYADFLHILATCFTLFHTCSCKIDVVTSPIVPSTKLTIATFISWINPLRTTHQFHSFIVHHLIAHKRGWPSRHGYEEKGLKEAEDQTSGGATWSCSSWGNKKRVTEAVVSGCFLHRDCIMHSVCPCINISQWVLFYCTSFII